MSLIESALARARARTNAGIPTPGTAPVSRRAPASKAPAAEPIDAPVIPVDMRVCQAQRVLIDEAADDNTEAVAAYRILRTRLLHRSRSRQWVTIGITSAGGNDGKSLTALNLALSLARERTTQVALLDLDMRNPSICRYLGISPPTEVRDFFEQRASVQDVFFRIGADKLLVASGLSATQAASELLGTQRFDDLVLYVKQHAANPIILIDLPPILRTDDALVLAPRVDAMLVVAAEGHTDRTGLNKTLEMLSEFNIAGIVLNKAIGSAQRLGYGYGNS
jgi:Mrp family chromosome partitioning ATPase